MLGKNHRIGKHPDNDPERRSFAQDPVPLAVPRKDRHGNHVIAYQSHPASTPGCWSRSDRSL